MCKKKIIHISFVSLKSSEETRMVDFEDLPYATWATRFANRTMQYTDEYDIESWSTYNPEHYGDNGILVRKKGGIVFRAFPAQRFTFRLFSISILKELKRRIKNREKILVHLQDMHDLMPSLVAHVCRRIPLVAQQRGGSVNPLWSLRCKKKYRYFIKILFDESSIRNFDFVFASSKGETEYISRKLGPDKVLHLKGSGFNFEKYIPIPKKEARKALGLSQDKKIILHIARFNTEMSVDASIDIYNKIKEKHDVEMVFIGGNKTNPLYGDVIRSGALVKAPMPKDEIIKYINASDVFLRATADISWLPFGDIPTTLIESLALNRPVVSPTLIHFMGTAEEMKKLGFVTKSRENGLKALEFIFANPERYENTREIIRKYYNWENIISKNCEVYGRLLKKYYKD